MQKQKLKTIKQQRINDNKKNSLYLRTEKEFEFYITKNLWARS